MKKVIICFIFLSLCNFFTVNTAYAETNNNYDNTINEIINGIDENTFNFITEFFNELFNDKRHKYPPPVFEGGNERCCNGIIIRADFHGYQIMVVSAFK